MARAIGKSVATVSKIASGEQACEVALFGQIADALHFDSLSALVAMNEQTAVSDYHTAIAKVFRRFKTPGTSKPRRRRAA